MKERARYHESCTSVLLHFLCLSYDESMIVTSTTCSPNFELSHLPAIVCQLVNARRSISSNLSSPKRHAYGFYVWGITSSSVRHLHLTFFHFVVAAAGKFVGLALGPNTRYYSHPSTLPDLRCSFPSDCDCQIVFKVKVSPLTTAISSSNFNSLYSAFTAHDAKFVPYFLGDTSHA